MPLETWQLWIIPGTLPILPDILSLRELRLKSTLSMKHNCNRESLKEFLLKIYSALQSATPHQTGSPCDGTIYMPSPYDMRLKDPQTTGNPFSLWLPFVHPPELTMTNMSSASVTHIGCAESTMRDTPIIQNRCQLHLS